VAYGQKETGRDIDHFDQYLVSSADWQDMDKCIGFLNAEGIYAQVIYPTLGLLWEGEVADPFLADALCRAYNIWAFELCASHKDCLFPAAHISMRDPQLAIKELERVAKLGRHSIFLAAMPINGRSWRHPDFDPIWAAAQDLNVSVGIHLASPSEYTGSQFYRDRDPGFMYVTMNIIQDPRQCLTTMVYDGVFERYPKLQAGSVEMELSWVPYFLDRMDYNYTQRAREIAGARFKADVLPSEFFHRHFFLSFQEDQMGIRDRAVIGVASLLWGSDYPHQESTFPKSQEFLQDILGDCTEAEWAKIVGGNAARVYNLN
jgi:predicted TIM-barrel fold metal-dependent hydrolase